MKLIKPTLYLLLLLPAILHAQKPRIDWSVDWTVDVTQVARYDNILQKSIAQTNDGNMIHALTFRTGTSLSSPPTNVLIKKRSADSVFTHWEKQYGGTKQDVCNSIMPTVDDGYAFCGSTQSVDGDLIGFTNKGSDDIWIVKLNASGHITWQKTYGGSLSDAAVAMRQTKDGGYIVTGTTSSSNGDMKKNQGGVDAFLMKLDVNGDTLWVKTYGGNQRDAMADVSQDTINGGYIVVGHTLSDNGDILLGGSTRKGGRDWWVIKTDNDGNIQWQKCYGGTSASTSYEEALTVYTRPDGSYIIGGHTVSKDGDVSMPKGGVAQDVWLVWIDHNGNITSDKCYGGIDIDNFASMSETDDGGYIITTCTNSVDGDVTGNDLAGWDGGLPSQKPIRPWVFKIDGSGQLLWEKYTYLPNDISYKGFTFSYVRGVVSADGGVVIVASEYTRKLSPCPAFTTLTATICEGANYDFNGTLLTTAGTYKDTLQTTGGCDSIITLTLKVNPVYHTSLSHVICAGDSYDFFGTLLTTADSYQHTLQSISGCDSIITLTLTLNALPVPNITANGSELSTGIFSSYQWLLDDVAIPDATTQSYTTSAEGNYRVVVTESNSCSDTSAVYTYIVTGIENTTESSISIYPNPVSDVLNIRYENNLPFDVSIFSMEGQEVLSQVCTANNALLDIHSLPQGFYIVKVFQNKELKTIQKLVKK